jgi:hypothetical protein
MGESGLGVASLVLGILGAVIAMIPCIGFGPGVTFGTMGVVLGGVGWASAGTKTGKGLPIAGTVLSICSIGIAVAWVYLIAETIKEAKEKAKEQGRLEKEDAREKAESVSLEVLGKAFEKNILQANKENKDKWLKVTGKVAIVKDTQFPAIYLDAGNKKLAMFGF